MLCFGSAVLCERSWQGIGTWHEQLLHILHAEEREQGAAEDGASLDGAPGALGEPLALNGFCREVEIVFGSKCSSCAGGRCAGQLFLPINISFNASSPQAMLINSSSPSLSKHLWC